MRNREQKKYIEALKRYEKKFEKKELDDFRMMLIRNKEDEDLDNISFKRLEELYTKYHLNRAKKQFDDIFNNDDKKNSNIKM